MIQYKIKWTKLRNGRLEQGSVSEPFDTYQDAYHAIKMMHQYAGEFFELRKIGKKKGAVHLHNPKTQTQFIIFWNISPHQKKEPAKPIKKKTNKVEQLFY